MSTLERYRKLLEAHERAGSPPANWLLLGNAYQEAANAAWSGPYENDAAEVKAALFAASRAADAAATEEEINHPNLEEK